MNLPEDPSGWWMQHKLDGIFCRWTGSAFLTRNGHRLSPPPWWFAGMPNTMLDGELWNHNGGFDDLVGDIQRKDSDWRGISFNVFDLPILRTPIELRISILRRLTLPEHVRLIRTIKCRSQSHLDALEERVVRRGGEGLVIRPPASPWIPQGYCKIKRLHADIDRSILD